MATRSLVFTVLCPNGRRQKLTVSSNASCLQVLEDACKKQNLNPEDYDLKHYNKRVDLSLSVRFANFPNNALLELHPTEQRRSDKAVTVGLQLESGERLMHDFLPSTSLWNIISHWHKQSNLKCDTEKGKPVCIYMRRELIGKEKLEKTTLRDLGLTSGKAVIRLLYREPESLKEQAHVYIPQNRSCIAAKEEETLAEMNIESSQDSNKNENPDSVVNVELNTNLHNERTSLGAYTFKQEILPILKRKQPKLNSDDSSDTFKISRESRNAADIPLHEIKLEHCHERNRECNSGADVEMEEVEEKVIYIGSRNAVLFNREDILPWKPEEIPDHFYELTIDDAKFIMHDLARQRKELEDKPLETAALREAKQLELLAKYKYTVIRIYFPERLVLQALFSSDDTVCDVMEFVKTFLNVKDITFNLFTTPPKQILSPGSVLYMAGLVPTAVLYFSSPEKRTSYLNDSLKTQISSPSAANQAAFFSRKGMTNGDKA